MSHFLRCVAWFAALSAAFFAWPMERVEARDCATPFRQKKYVTAAACFLRSARKLGPTSRLQSAARLKKGGLLRNAAISFMKAAGQQQGPQQAYLQERAMFALRGYYRDQLCASKSRCAAAKRQSQKLYRAIRYSRLSLAFPQTPIAVQVTGFRYKTKKLLERSPWRLRLRPGTYRISLFGLGQKKEVAVIALAPSEKKSWTYRPAPRLTARPRPRPSAPRARRPAPPRAIAKRTAPLQAQAARRAAPVQASPRAKATSPSPRRVVAPPRRATQVVAKAPQKPTRRVAARAVSPAPRPKAGLPPAAIALYATGGVVFFVGLAVGGYALYAHAEGSAKFDSEDATLDAAEALKASHQAALPIGIACLGVGAAALAVAGVIHVTSAPRRASPPQTTAAHAFVIWEGH